MTVSGRIVTVAERLGRAGEELAGLDRAVYAAMQATPSPTLDHAVGRLSRAADKSRLWLAVAAVLAVTGERRRRAALVGVAALGATSAVVNAVGKPVFRRRRPFRGDTVHSYLVRMPRSASYPSGHAASAFAFSAAVGGGLPELDTALRLMATAVAYSRVHTGVHYPGDVIAGAIVGAGIGSTARHLAQRRGLIGRRAPESTTGGTARRPSLLS